MKIPSKSPLKFQLLLCGLALILIFFLMNLQDKNKTRIIISKSTFPSWDLLETSAKELSFSKLTSPYYFDHYSSYSEVMEAFISGKSQMATLTIYEALSAYARLNGEVVILLLLDYTVGSDGVIAQPTIDHLTSLKGKRIGTVYGTIAHYTLMKALNRAGLKLSDVKLTNTSAENLNTLFKSGKLDAISTFDPFLYDLSKTQTNPNILFSSKEIPGKICDVLIAHKSFAYQNQKYIKEIKRNWFDAVRTNKRYEKISSISHYYDKQYLKHIENNIFLTGELENLAAFGDIQNPGYLFKGIKDMADFLVIIGHLPNDFSITYDVLFNTQNKNI